MCNECNYRVKKKQITAAKLRERCSREGEMNLICERKYEHFRLILFFSVTVPKTSIRMAKLLWNKCGRKKQKKNHQTIYLFIINLFIYLFASVFNQCQITKKQHKNLLNTHKYTDTCRPGLIFIYKYNWLYVCGGNNTRIAC